MTLVRALTVLVTLGALSAEAVDVGIPGLKLLVVQKAGFVSRKVVYVAKNDPGIQKGAAGDPALLSGAFEVFYTDRPDSVSGAFVIEDLWRTLTDTVAKYSNSVAPSGSWGGTRVTVIKDGKLVKFVARSLGDRQMKIDMIAAGPPSDVDGVSTVLTFVNGNDGTTRRMCSRFAVADGSTVIFKEIGGGTGRKLKAKSGVPAPCP